MQRAENKKIIPETANNKPLSDEQLSEVWGGADPVVIVQPMPHKFCAANPTHVYIFTLDACPVCGCKEFTYK